MGFSLQAVGPHGEEREEYLSLSTAAMSAVTKLLKAAHCTLGKVKKPKHHKGKLVVKAQSTRPGTVLADGASVSVKLGPKPHHKNRH